MNTESTRNWISVIIVLIIIIGFCAGIAVGYSLMGPTADTIRRAAEYPELYEDELLERHWTGSSTVAMIAVWFISAFVAMNLHIKSLMLEMMEELVKDTKSKSQKYPNENTEPKVETKSIVE